MKTIMLYLAAIELFNPKTNADYIVVLIITAIVFTLIGLLLRPISSRLWAMISTPWAFKMKFTKENFKPPYTKEQKIINQGKSEIWLMVGPRTMTTFHGFDLRFVTKANRIWKRTPKNVPKEIIHIETVQHQEDAPSPDMPVTNNREGGVNVRIKKPFPRSNQEYFWLRVKIFASREWEGMISFRSTTALGRRSCRRLPIKVV